MRTFHSSLCRRLGLWAGLGACAWSATALSAAILLRESFDYPDGALLDVAGGLWENGSGTAGQTQVTGGRLCLTEAGNEAVRGSLAGQPFGSQSTNILYARLTVNFSHLPSASAGAYFAHFRDGGNRYRVKVFGTTAGATPGNLRLGIANASNSVVVAHPADVALNSSHVVVLRWAIKDAVGTLWLDPKAETDPSVTADDSASAASVVAFAFRQVSGMGILTVDDLVVADNFAEALAPGPAPRLPPVVLFTNRLEHLVRPGEMPTNSYTELVLLPGEQLSSSVSATDPQGQSVTLTGSGGPTPPGAAWQVTDSGAPRASAVWCWQATTSDAGHEYQVALVAHNAAGDAPTTWTLYVPTAAEQHVILSEFLANPSSDPAASHFNPLRRAPPCPSPDVQDEYVELVNTAPQPVDLGGWMLADAVKVRHQFTAPFLLPAWGPVVVYGGPAEGYPPNLGVPAVPASGGSSGLALNNDTDTILVRNGASNLLMRVTYQASQLSKGGSLTRFPDFNSPFVAHDQISALPVSPGRKYDGTAFGPGTAVPILGDFHIALLAGQTIRLTWTADPASSYTVWATDSLAAPFQPLAVSLQFTDGQGQFIQPVPRNSPQTYYRISSP